MSDIDDIRSRPHAEGDDRMHDEDDDDAGEDVEMGQAIEDSSEEESDDEEEARKIREGFIVDEDEDEEEVQERTKRHKRRKKRHHREEDEQLEEDDLELLEENTGASFRNRLTRLRRGRESESPPTASSSRRKTVIESSDEDLDNDPGTQRRGGISSLWDDERRGDDEEEGDMDTDSFIEYSDEEEGMGEDNREERRREKKQDAERRKRARRVRPELAGIDANAWDEIHDVFGDGHDYDWALAGDDEMDYEEEHLKPEMRYQDVFEPSEIRKRMLTEDDDLIRAQDIPERMQIANSTLSQTSSLLLQAPMTEDDLNGAAMWIIQKLPSKKIALFFAEGGQYFHLSSQLVLAVTFVLRALFLEEYEVPYIWTHKRDYISHLDRETGERVELLSLPDLWTILQYGYKYRSLLERRKTLQTFYERLHVDDHYFETDIMPKIDGIEVVADATDWLSMKYKDKKQDAGVDFHFHDDEEPQPDAKKHKAPSRISAYEVAKKSVVAKLAKAFGIEAQQVVQNFVTASHLHDVEDPDIPPNAYAEQFQDPDPSKALSSDELLARARLILATELGKDPLLRAAMRKRFRDEALISVEPTERGLNKIDDHHPYYNFKYLFRKPIKHMLESRQFLQILAAEAEHLVTVSIFIPPATRDAFQKGLTDAISSDDFRASGEWNVERARIVTEVLEQHLIPVATKWAREYLREEVEDFLAYRCGEELRKRVDVAPYVTRPLGEGEYASSVLAMSWGKGDPHKDAITVVFLDEAGRMREHTKIDNLHDTDPLDEFFDLLKRRKPDVIGVSGFSMATMKLVNRVKTLLKGSPMGEDGHSNQQSFDTPVIYVRDEVARIYQHSKRAENEFPSIPPIARYCVGLARYLQSPLNEYAALSSDITAITFSDEDQHLIPREKLLNSFEKVLVDITNKVGVNINRAVADEYYQLLLPFVCGLGPRKAQAMVKKIVAVGGNLNNREQFIKGKILTTKIFFNASAFLRIPQYKEYANLQPQADDETAPDPLDDTRIHLEDYELARKMATDALEEDEEDYQGKHPSVIVTDLLKDKDKERKLMELNLDDFAVSLYEANQEDKRHTLGMIREELLRPFSEQRRPYRIMDGWDVISMLSGENEQTLNLCNILPVSVVRISKPVVNVKLDSGVEGIIGSEYLSDNPNLHPDKVVKKGQTVEAIIIERKFNWDDDSFHVEFSCRSEEMKDGIRDFRIVRPDDNWNHALDHREKDLLDRKKRSQNTQARRVIKHPNFHNFNATQAEVYLEKQQRGDVVIRPSSKGANHLAVTWKVDNGLYQHIDVTDTGNPNDQVINGELVVDPVHKYTDLDELIVNHIQAMARKVEELMAHEKFKNGSEDELHIHLKNVLAANPTKSMYGFTLNRKRPGHFNLCFLANKNASVQTWPVRVAPEAYYLFDAAAAGVPELCDAFKIRHAAAASAVPANGGKTPYGAGMGRTPARPLGGATPGHMSVRRPMQVGQTPNPYGGPPGYGQPPPPGAYGYQPPAAFPPGQPPMPPTGMPPPRPPPMQGGWGVNPGGW